MEIILVVMGVALIGLFVLIIRTDIRLVGLFREIEKTQEKINQELDKIKFEQEVEKNRDKIDRYAKYHGYTGWGYGLYSDCLSRDNTIYFHSFSNEYKIDTPVALSVVLEFISNVDRVKDVICKEECEKIKESNGVFTAPTSGTYYVSASVVPNKVYVDECLIKKAPKKKKGKKK